MSLKLKSPSMWIEGSFLLRLNVLKLILEELKGFTRSTGFSICACLNLSVSSSSWGLGRAAVCDCGTPWTFLLPFLLYSEQFYFVYPTNCLKQ